MPRRLAAVLPIVSGILLALCLPRPGLCPLGWVGLAPLFYALSHRPLRDSFTIGLAAGFAFHGVALYWIYSTCRFALVPLPGAVFAWAALAAFQALAWGAAAWFGRWAAQALPQRWRALGWAVAWTAVAVACEWWTPRLPADLLEYTQWRFLSLLQIASMTGPHGLGFIVAFVNASIAQAWDQSQGRGGEEACAAPGLALAMALAAAAWGYGVWSLAGREASGETARVEVLQPNIDQYHKWSPAFAHSILGVFDGLLARPRTAAPSLIIWPESALPRWVREGASPSEAAVWSRALRAFQVVGAVTEGGGSHYNSALLIGPDGSLRGAYHKRELVPFGEYVPVVWARRFIASLNELGGIDAGARAQTLFKTPLGATAATICYEAAFPRWTRRDVARGARLLINITNDGWYKDTWGPYQHFQTNVFRAIEARVPVIRSGNTGISAVIDPWGVVLAREDLGKRGRLDADVPSGDPFPRRSLYARRGDWFGALMLGLALFVAAAAGLRALKAG